MRYVLERASILLSSCQTASGLGNSVSVGGCLSRDCKESIPPARTSTIQSKISYSTSAHRYTGTTRSHHFSAEVFDT